MGGIERDAEWRTSVGTMKLDLDAIEKRERAATPGPWAWESVSNDDNEWGLGVVDPPQTGEIVEAFDEATREYGEKPIVVESIATSGPDGTFDDAAFIAHAREDIPALIAHAREQAATIARLRKVVGSLGGHLGYAIGTIENVLPTVAEIDTDEETEDVEAWLVEVRNALAKVDAEELK